MIIGKNDGPKKCIGRQSKLGISRELNIIVTCDLTSPMAYDIVERKSRVSRGIMSIHIAEKTTTSVTYVLVPTTPDILSSELPLRHIFHIPLQRIRQART